MAERATPPIEPLTVELQLVPARRDDGAVHVEGTARIAPDGAHTFSGWMSLLQLLESMVATAGDGDGRRP
jgi:hypothetical protein